MKRKTFVSLMLALLTSISIVAVLFIVSDDIVHRRNAFYRQFPPHPMIEGDTLDLEFNSYYFAGATDHGVYLGNTTAPLHVIRVNNDLADSQHISIQAEEFDQMKFWALRVKVDSPYFYLADGAVPVVFKGRVQDWRGFDQRFDSAFFLDFEPVSQNSLLIRSISSKTNEFVLGKERMDIGSVILNDNLLQKQIDGRFCVDGMLHYNKELNKVAYVYYYRNQYIVTDTSLNLFYKGKTIDTISHAQIKIAAVDSKGGRMLAAPPLYVNKHSCVWKNLLFIHSGILARNEDIKAFDNASVIDVYDLNQGNYKFSFYIPHLKGTRMHDFIICGETMYILEDKYLISCKLSLPYFLPDDQDILHVGSG